MPKPKLPDLSTLSEEDALATKLSEVRASRSKLGVGHGTATAISSFHRLEADLVRQLAEVRKAAATSSGDAPDLADDKSDDELVSGLIDAISGLPDAAVDAIDCAIQLRRSGKPGLKLVAAGDGGDAE